MMPSKVLLMIACSDDSTMAARQARIPSTPSGPVTPAAVLLFVCINFAVFFRNRGFPRPLTFSNQWCRAEGMTPKSVKQFHKRFVIGTGPS